jgi:DNA-binding response OmpR family regulator
MNEGARLTEFSRSTIVTSSQRGNESTFPLGGEHELSSQMGQMGLCIPVIDVIEKDMLLRSLLVEWLTAEGYRVNVANGVNACGRDPEAAVVAATDQSTAQLLIVDVFMPRGHGVERLRSARVAHPGVPVIAISGQFDRGIGAAGAAAAALDVDRVVAKPFGREAMLDAVRSLIGRPG